MGRTRRKRERRKFSQAGDFSLDDKAETIALKQWMTTSGWKNDSQLKLKFFETTGRGVSSTRNIHPNDRLIQIPYSLLITYTVVVKSELADGISRSCTKEKFKMQELLALFLAMERHKGESSEWRHYIKTLPQEVPLLPWLCTDEEIQFLPSEFEAEVRKGRRNFESSWKRIRKILPNFTCTCCQIPSSRIVNIKFYIWAYAMVNTRVVYVQPDVVLRLSDSKLITHLSDEPSLALCPFLDMFNHSDRANTSADLIFEGNSWNYTLTTSDDYKRQEQVFISYGPHDNMKLLCEYGFFVAKNCMDSVDFTPDDVLFKTVTNSQYRYIRDLWKENLSVSLSGLSFHLKAAFYVALNANNSDWSGVIFCQNYAKSDFRAMHDLTKKLLSTKLMTCVKETEKLESLEFGTKYFKNVLRYFKYRVLFVEDLLLFIEDKINDT